MLRNVRTVSFGLLCSVLGAGAAEAGTQGFRLAGHSGVASVDDANAFRLSRGTDDLLFVWTQDEGLPRAWRRIEPDAGTILQGDRVGLLGDETLAWLSLPSLESVSSAAISGSVMCRGAALAWSWTEAGAVTLHSASGSETLSLRAAPGEDASCLISPLGTTLIWSEERGVAALVHGASTELLNAPVANEGLVDAGASATSVWANVRSAGSDRVTRVTLTGEAPSGAAAGSGWRTCDTFDASGQPLPCATLDPAQAIFVSRPAVPAWNRAQWSNERLVLAAPGGTPAMQPSEAGWAFAQPERLEGRAEASEPTEVVVRGRRLRWVPVWVAGCAQQGWKVEEERGATTVAVAGPICGAAPRWVPTPDDRSALLELPDRGSALVWSEGPQPSRLILPDAGKLALTLALRTATGWWVADAAQGHAWRQSSEATTAWTEASVPLLADRTLTLSKSGEVLTLAPANSAIPTTHFIVTDRGTVAWQDDGRWWSDIALRRQLVWVAADGVPYPTDDASVSKRFDKRLLVDLWDRLIDER